MSPALATEETIVFILSCRTLLCPYENSVSDSEFCIFFFFFCDAESSEKINRDVTGDLGDDKKGTKDQASPVVGVWMSGRTWGIRESPQSQGSSGAGESWS